MPALSDKEANALVLRFEQAAMAATLQNMPPVVAAGVYAELLESRQELIAALVTDNTCSPPPT